MMGRKREGEKEEGGGKVEIRYNTYISIPFILWEDYQSIMNTVFQILVELDMT